MATNNPDFDIETEIDLDNIDEGAAKALLKRGEKPAETEIVFPEAKEEKAEKGPSVDDLENYSENVKQRINKLTFDREEANRQAAQAARERDEAIQFAQQALAQRKQFEEQAKKLSETSQTAEMARIEADTAATKKQLKEALDAYDTEAATEAQIKLSELISQRNWLQLQKAAKPVAEPKDSVVQPQTSTRPALDSRAQDWVARNNAWFQKDKAMTAYIFGVHEELVDQGVDPRTDADNYYSKLDEAIKARFPEKFETPDKENRSPSSPVAPASRTVSGKKRVVLSAREISLANRLGLTVEQFAAEKLKLEKSNG